MFDPIYKGGTTVSTMFGVPLLPFIVVTLIFGELAIPAFYLLGAAGLIPIGLTYGVLFRWARNLGRHDEQRLLQVIKRAQIRLPQLRSIRCWGAVTFGPVRTKGQRS